MHVYYITYVNVICYINYKQDLKYIWISRVDVPSLNSLVRKNQSKIDPSFNWPMSVGWVKTVNKQTSFFSKCHQKSWNLKIRCYLIICRFMFFLKKELMLAVTLRRPDFTVRASLSTWGKKKRVDSWMLKMVEVVESFTFWWIVYFFVFMWFIE